ncbi:MAG: hypothetical protein NC131_18460 [Roseburia sp.]|nr:hypothetical protein [Roseburia sp.]
MENIGNENLSKLALEVRRAYYREYRAKNRDKIREQQRANKDYYKKYYDENRERINAKARERYHNSDRTKITQKKRINIMCIFDDNPKDDNADIDELDLWDLLDEDEE